MQPSLTSQPAADFSQFCLLQVRIDVATNYRVYGAQFQFTAAALNSQGPGPRKPAFPYTLPSQPQVWLQLLLACRGSSAHAWFMRS